MAVDLFRDGLVRVERDSPSGEETDLERFALRASLEGETKPLPEATPAPEGPCRVCNERTSSAVCHQCHRPVCAAHHWSMLGLCRACLPGEQMRKAREPVLRPRPDLGIKWVEE